MPVETQVCLGFTLTAPRCSLLFVLFFWLIAASFISLGFLVHRLYPSARLECQTPELVCDEEMGQDPSQLLDADPLPEYRSRHRKDEDECDRCCGLFCLFWCLHMIH